ncbi:MAG: glycosyltransferase family 2 protein [Anaerolineaceae bacterium]|nr:glycosyltransferase family 2 protein [Anaerolineaceae bacterium]
MKLSIVIVSWNTSAMLEACLASVYLFPPHDQFEVWVVDNHSSDDTVSMVQRKFPQVNLIVSEENLGFAGGNNLAIARCVGEFILLLNSDTEVKANALQRLIDFMNANVDAGAVGSRLLNMDGSLQVSCHPFPTLLRELWRLFHLDGLYAYSEYRMALWRTDVPRRVEAIKGASLMLRRMVLETVGYLDERYFMYSEEVDLCFQINRAGWQLYWEPGSEVVHYGEQSTRQVAQEMFLQLYRGKLIYFRKNYGRIAGIAYKLILALAALARLSLLPIAWWRWPSKREKNRVLAQNYKCLLTALPSM